VINLHGVFPPLPTPFAAGEIDAAALRSNAGRLMRTGLRGLVVLGSNGEAPLVDDDEADRALMAAREAVPRDRVLIAGTGRESTRATIAATRRAADAGADAVLVRTPSFFKSQMTTDAFVRHYTAVADASPVPVLLYNYTALTGVNLLPAAVARLAPHPNIAGVKESSGDVAQMAEYLAVSSGEAFAVLAGSVPTFYAGLCVGAVGGVLALACVLPDACVRVFDLAREGRHDDARALQRRITPLAKAVTVQYGVAGLKAAMEMVGLAGGEPRLPLGPIPADARREIHRQLEELTSEGTRNEERGTSSAPVV
jgi:4-hydroxy-2-oxoglutarate aldolase